MIFVVIVVIMLNNNNNNNSKQSSEFRLNLNFQLVCGLSFVFVAVGFEFFFGWPTKMKTISLVFLLYFQWYSWNENLAMAIIEIWNFNFFLSNFQNCFCVTKFVFFSKPWPRRWCHHDWFYFCCCFCCCFWLSFISWIWWCFS